ncbi:erythromycin esterase family protein [Hymenobacter endophyticus]|uniref:Erythromycin esterase family protein n=1 Tax=Hymenobacter endophyticus TaxID=3076335 RepID=A0ABU3TDS8_9BACT|nr:erythromycin esterase family protein [Hymenobacter endophyticus]MDU0369494.1 erythromycin esterase family protein [Hymenobacter endophyticus]
MFSIRMLALSGLLSVLAGPLLAQNAPGITAAAAPIKTYPVRTISPTDADLSDLEFLRQEIGPARVVMLGEPTHGVGTATEAKVRLIRFLAERMGFTTVAFESSLYPLDQAERAIQAGTPVPAAIAASVYPVWTETREFQALLPLLGKGKLHVAGFDSQVGWGHDDMLDELETFLKPEKGSSDIAYDYLDECISTMGEHNIFPPSHQLVFFKMQLGKARKILDKVAVGPDAKRRERAGFWLQQLRSVQALAQDYASNDPGAKDSATFKAADSNARDAQMADNLLWYLRNHPQEKVICWGAIGHLSNKTAGLESEELKGFRPMGQAVKAALGEEAVYVLSTVAGSGTHGFGYWGKQQPVPVPAPGTLEAELLAQGSEYSFVSLKHDAPGRRLTTYAFEFLPISGPWSEAIDGLLYLKTVAPPQPAQATAAATPTEAVAAAAPPAVLSRQSPTVRPAAGKTGAALVLSGTVLDRKTGQPVPFATVAIPSRSAGTVTDAQGRFRLEARLGEQVQVSSIGYEPATLAAQNPTALQVRLVPAAFALADVRVSAQSQDPKRIMKKVIKAIETNYERQDYAQDLYVHRRIMGYDTLRHELEYTGRQWTPAGYQHWAGGFLMLEKRPVIQVQEKREATTKADGRAYSEPGYGFSGGFDPVRVSPLFKSATLGRFRLQLDSIEQRGGEVYYVLSFAAKKASHRATGMGFIQGYSGRIYVREQDYAVVRYESLWQHDTAEVNAIAHKYYGTKSNIRHFFNAVYQDHRTTHVVTYQQAGNGRYYASASVAQALEVGHMLSGRGRHFYNQKTCDVYYAPPVVVPAAEVPDPNARPELRGDSTGIWQVGKVSNRPDFWQTYQRPTPVEAAPTLEVTR